MARAESASVSPTPPSRNCALSMTGSKSRSIATTPWGASLHRLDHFLLGGNQLRMNRLFDRLRPFEEFRLLLVDRNANALRFFGAALAVVVLRQGRESLHLARHRHIWDAVDGRGVGALRHHVLERCGRT